MARLTLQLQDRVLKEYAIGRMATIGRQADNTIVIDSPAVSSHHASLVNDGGLLAVEDLQSTNGTFVNGVRVSRKILKHGDVLQVGKHSLMLDQMSDGEAQRVEDAGEPTPNQGETVFIDKRTLVARLMQSETEARKYDVLLARLTDVETAARRATTEAQTAVLRVIAGRADQTVYRLDGADLDDRQEAIVSRPLARLVQAAARAGDLAQPSRVRGHVARRRDHHRQQTHQWTP